MNCSTRLLTRRLTPLVKSTFQYRELVFTVLCTYALNKLNAEFFFIWVFFIVKNFTKRYIFFVVFN